MKISFLTPGGLVLSRYEIRNPRRPIEVGLTADNEPMLVVDNLWLAVYSYKMCAWIVSDAGRNEVGLHEFHRFTIEV